MSNNESNKMIIIWTGIGRFSSRM